MQTFIKIKYIVISLATLLFVALAFYFKYIEIKDVAIGLLALMGTITGATLAFRLNENREIQKEDAKRRHSLNSTLFILGRQLNAIYLIKDELDKYKTEFDKAFNMPALSLSSYSDLVFQFVDLDFLLTNDINTVFRLSIVQESFFQALESQKNKSNYHHDVIQGIIEKLHLNNQMMSMRDMKHRIGDRIFTTAINNTKELCAHTDECIKSIIDMQNELHMVAKNHYPKFKFIRTEKA